MPFADAYALYLPNKCLIKSAKLDVFFFVSMSASNSNRAWKNGDSRKSLMPLTRGVEHEEKEPGTSIIHGSKRS